MNTRPKITPTTDFISDDCTKGGRTAVLSKVPRTLPSVPVPDDDFVLQDPDGFPLQDPEDGTNLTTQP